MVVVVVVVFVLLLLVLVGVLCQADSGSPVRRVIAVAL